MIAFGRSRTAQRDDQGKEEKAGEPLASLLMSYCSRTIVLYHPFLYSLAAAAQ